MQTIFIICDESDSILIFRDIELVTELGLKSEKLRRFQEKLEAILEFVVRATQLGIGIESVQVVHNADPLAGIRYLPSIRKNEVHYVKELSFKFARHTLNLAFFEFLGLSLIRGQFWCFFEN